jgi:hypothetical protein
MPIGGGIFHAFQKALNSYTISKQLTIAKKYIPPEKNASGFPGAFSPAV